MYGEPTIVEHLERANQPLDRIPADTREAIVRRIVAQEQERVEVARFTSAI